MPTYTTNYDLAKPLVNDATDQDLWGGYLNDDMDDIDSIMFRGNNWVKRVVTTTDTATTADQNKIILGDATVASYVETLPSAATAGDGFAIVLVKTDATANTITIDGDGTDTILGAANLVLSSQYQGVMLVSDGVSNWNPMGYDTIPSASDTVAGKIEIATAAEVATASSTTLAVVPGRMTSHWGVLKGVVEFDGSGAIISQKGDIASVSGSGGTYTVTTGTTYVAIYPWASMEANDVTRTSAATVNAFMETGTTITVHAQKYSSGAYAPTSITVGFFAAA